MRPVRHRDGGRSPFCSWAGSRTGLLSMVAIVCGIYVIAWTFRSPEPSMSPESQNMLLAEEQHVVLLPPVQALERPSADKLFEEPFVDFILPQIERDDATRAGRCEKDICHQQCDPACLQYPRKIRECKTAPCDDEPLLLYETELEYPLFHVNMPLFADENARQHFLSASPVRTDYLEQHASCPAPQSKNPEPRCTLVAPFDSTEKLLFSAVPYIRGHIAVVKDGYYNGVPDDSFDEHRKCAYSSNYHMIIPPATTIPPQQHFDKLLILMMSVTGGAYFQHFIDRGLSILVQAWSMLQKDPDIKLLVSPIFDRHPIVPQIYERLGLKDRLVYRSLLPITASKMYFSCVSPHYHPYVYQKARDILGIDTHYPLEKRRTIVYLSREGYSRHVLNEDVLVKHINMLLEEMAAEGGEKYTLQVFQHRDMPHLNATIAYFNTQARALIGPHGGAFYNQIFCASNTLLVEFFPYRPKADGEFAALRWPEAVWWPAAFMGHTYYQVPSVIQNAIMEVDIPAVLRILRKELWPRQ